MSGEIVNHKKLANLPEAAKFPLQTGCYSLVISLTHKKSVRVGKFGVARFPKGTYVYTGSAMKGLAARLGRHLGRRKKLHWHIDHLLTSPDARVVEIIVYPPAPNQECLQNQRIAVLPGATVVLKRFGATDCKSGCESHLYLFAKGSLLKLASGFSPLSAVYRVRRGKRFRFSPTH